MKSISPATVTVGVLAIVLGLVGVYVARNAMTKPEAPEYRRDPIVRKAPGPAVVFARVNLPAKTRITSRDLTVRRLESGAERPAGSIADVDEIIGRITKSPIRAGTIMSDDPLFDIGEGPNPADMIPAGHVAVPISVTGSHIENGLIRMGSRVNVSATWETDDIEEGLVVTKTILNDILVISTGKEDFELPSPNMSSRDRRRIENQNGRQEEQILVAVTNEQKNQLITAQTFGTISVALNSFDGGAPADAAEVNAVAMLGIPKPEKTIPVRHEVPEPPRVHRVERWNGNTMEVIEFPAKIIDEAHNATLVDQSRGGNTVPVNIKNPE